MRAHNNRACCLVCNGRYAEAERELLACQKIAPKTAEPFYNLALLRWQVGEKRAAAEGWLKFRGWGLSHSPNTYAERAERMPQPTVKRGPESITAIVTGAVDAGSLAALDRAMLRYWAQQRSDEELKRHWGRAAPM